jgi:lipopolysaccharide transport system permease protein
MCLYTFVFGILFKGSFHPDRAENPLVYGIGIYIGLSVLGLINDTIGQSAYSVIGSPNLVKKVVFPLELLPLTSVSLPLIQSMVGLLISGVALSLLGFEITWRYGYVFFLVVPVVSISVGLAWLIGGLTVYFKDMIHITGLVTQVLFWSSGIFYAAHTVQDYPIAWMFLRWNPILLTIEEIRNVMLWGSPISLMRVGYVYLVGLCCWTIGFWVFKRLRSGFADIM